MRASVNDPGDQAGDLDQRLAAAAERLGHAARLLLRAAAGRHGLSIAQAEVVLRLASDVTGASGSVAGLTAWLDVRQPTVSDAVTALERKGVVAKARDGRTQRLTLTPSGEAVAADLAGWDDPLRRALADEPVRVRGETLTVMLNAIGALHAAGVVTVARSCTTCRFFERAAPDTGRRHHCALLDAPLHSTDLRLDCPEHEPSTEAPKHIELSAGTGPDEHR